MDIKSVFDPAFHAYGKVLEGYDTAELREAMEAIPMPDSGVSYEPAVASLERCAVFRELEDRGFGGMPIELGMCWGYNTKLNCLEYHRDSEINIPADDVVLLLAKMEQLRDGVLDTADVAAFRVPAGCAVEVYATTLHYAPCHTDGAKGFRVAIVLPRGTNTDKPSFPARTAEDRRMTARNKWLLAHPDSDEAAAGAYIGLSGSNPDIAGDL